MHPLGQDLAAVGTEASSRAWRGVGGGWGWAEALEADEAVAPLVRSDEGDEGRAGAVGVVEGVADLVSAIHN